MREFDERIAWWQKQARHALLALIRRGTVRRRHVPAWLLRLVRVPTNAEVRLLCATFADLADAGRQADRAFRKLGVAIGTARANGPLDEAGA